jgi:hypothetical protein
MAFFPPVPEESLVTITQNLLGDLFWTGGGRALTEQEQGPEFNAQ